MKIGIVDLDTSHPAAWIPILKDLGHDVVGVHDHGDIHPTGYAERFVQEHNGGQVFSSLLQMVERVDCAVIHACNWDVHVERARPFVEAGKAVLVDKPIAGNLRDLNQFTAWADTGARITGGSSLRFSDEPRCYLARPIEERGSPHTVFCGCAVDEFNYGIHAYSLLATLMANSGATAKPRTAISVRHLGRGPQRRIQIKWPDGRVGFVLVGTAARWLPFHAAVVTESDVEQILTNNGRLYRALLENVLDYLASEVDQPPLPIRDLVVPELWALAAKQSWENDDREVRLDELDVSDKGYDGGAFAASYRIQRYPDQTATQCEG